MALQLVKTFPTGFSGNYWRIEEVKLSMSGESIYILALYKDEATRNTPGSAPILRQPVIGNTITTLSAAGDIRAAWYAEVKRSRLDENDVETNPFADAIDIIDV